MFTPGERQSVLTQNERRAKDEISKCNVCLANRARHSQKSQFSSKIFHPSPFVKGWHRIMCHRQQRITSCLRLLQQLLRGVLSVQSHNVQCRELKIFFTQHGVPDTLVTDSGTQFSSPEFAVSARTWNFDHVTSSPRYPQSNKKAENAVKTVKQQFNKCKQSGQAEFQALLDWRNTLTEGMKTIASPA